MKEVTFLNNGELPISFPVRLFANEEIRFNNCPSVTKSVRNASNLQLIMSIRAAMRFHTECQSSTKSAELM